MPLVKMPSHLREKTPVLDQGFVRLVDALRRAQGAPGGGYRVPGCLSANGARMTFTKALAALRRVFTSPISTESLEPR